MRFGKGGERGWGVGGVIVVDDEKGDTGDKMLWPVVDVEGVRSRITSVLRLSLFKMVYQRRRSQMVMQLIKLSLKF